MENIFDKIARDQQLMRDTASHYGFFIRYGFVTEVEVTKPYRIKNP
jgi:hypothetical protein